MNEDNNGNMQKPEEDFSSLISAVGGDDEYENKVSEPIEDVSSLISGVGGYEPEEDRSYADKGETYAEPVTSYQNPMMQEPTHNSSYSDSYNRPVNENINTTEEKPTLAERIEEEEEEDKERKKKEKEMITVSANSLMYSFILIFIVFLLAMFVIVIVMNGGDPAENVTSAAQNSTQAPTTLEQKLGDTATLTEDYSLLQNISDKQSVSAGKLFKEDYTTKDTESSPWSKSAGIETSLKYTSYGEVKATGTRTSGVKDILSDVTTPIVMIDNEYEKTELTNVGSSGTILYLTFATTNKSAKTLVKKIDSLTINDYSLVNVKISDKSDYENYTKTIAPSETVEFTAECILSNDDNTYSQMYRQFNLDLDGVNKIGFKNFAYSQDVSGNNTLLSIDNCEGYLRGKDKYQSPINKLTKLADTELYTVYLGKSGFSTYNDLAQYFYYIYIYNKTNRTIFYRFNPYYKLNEFTREDLEGTTDEKYSTSIRSGGIGCFVARIERTNNNDFSKLNGEPLYKVRFVIKGFDTKNKGTDGAGVLTVNSDYCIFDEDTMNSLPPIDNGNQTTSQTQSKSTDDFSDLTF